MFLLLEPDCFLLCDFFCWLHNNLIIKIVDFIELNLNLKELIKVLLK